MLRSLWPSVNRGRAGYWHGDDEAPRAEGRSDQVRRRYCDRISGERARERERDWLTGDDVTTRRRRRRSTTVRSTTTEFVCTQRARCKQATNAAAGNATTSDAAASAVNTGVFPVQHPPVPSVGALLTRPPTDTLFTNGKSKQLRCAASQTRRSN